MHVSRLRKSVGLCCHAAALGFIFGAVHAPAQTTRTWNGSVNSDWFNPTNWIPAGVPATNDIVNVTNGTVNLTAPVTIAGQLNWSAGTFTGNPMTIASNGVMNVNCTATLFLENALTNAGTITLSNNSGTLWVINNNGAPYAGLIENLSGALFDIQNDQTMLNDAGATAYFHNAGTLRKSGTTGATYISIPLINSGSVTGLQGTLNFNGGGTLAGNFTAASGAAITFSGGYFTNSTPVAINGPGTFQLTGNASLTLLADAIANLPLVGGTVYLGPAFQGGTITNLTISGATLAGTNTVTGTFNWNSGTIAGGPLTIASNAAMNINAVNTLYLQNPLTNWGTVTWTNTGSLGDLNVLNNNGAPYAGLIENLPGALFDIQCDQSLVNNAGATAYFHNLGTLRKSAKSGITSFQIPIINSGLVTGLQGTLSFGGGGTLAGTFAAATNATINFSGGNFTNSGPVSIIGPGIVQLSANAALILLADAIPNLPLVGGTVHLGPAFQGGTITNLTLSGATLTGTNTVTGTFNWNSGAIAGGPLTIASNAVMNINAVNTLYLENPLTNWGTVTWTNTGFLGDLDVLNNNDLPYAGLIENLPGALFDIQCDHVLFNNAGAAAYFHNAGTLRKSANSGTTQFDIPIINSGLVTGLQGTLSFGGGGILAGTFADATNATINFSVGSFTNSGPVSIDGPGPIQLTGGNLWLLTDEIANLPLAGGTVSLGPAFQGGTITNLTIAGATLAGTNIVTGTFNWNNGTIAGGPLTIDSNGVMNINASTTLYLENPLTNWGTVTWTNTGFLGDLDVLNNNGLPYAGLIENLPGALFDIQCDHSLFNNAGSTAYFHNLGLLQKSAKSGTTGVSLPVTNSGTIASLKGNLAFSGGFTPVGGSLLFGLSSSSSFGVMSISGNATLGGTVGVLWLNGFVPASGNAFTVLNYGSYSGIFTNVTVPPSAAVWLTNYGPTSFTMSVASINKLAFTTQPVGGKLTNIIIAPVVVQIADPSNNPVAVSGVPITMAINSGAGIINGTLTQNTDSTGKSTFGDLSFSAIGTKTLRATSSGLTTAISVPFQIVPLIGLQWTGAGFLIQLNGTNSLAPVIIYASTNLSSWIPIYTNAPTNGPIQFLDASATNYRARFYHTSEY
jgi:hypothetical protein